MKIAVAAVVIGLAAITPQPPPFEPFPVGPAAPDGVHITVWAPDPATGRAWCLDELSWYWPGEADCWAEPEVMAPDLTEPGWLAGWAERFAPEWAQID